MTRRSIGCSSELISLSHARDLLSKSMFGSLRRVPQVAAIHSKLNLRVAFLPQLERANALLRFACLDGEITVYAMIDGGEPLAIDSELLRRIQPIRQGIPHECNRITSGADDTNPSQLRKLNAIRLGRLYVRQADFNAWKDAQRKRRKFPSQSSTPPKGPRRPGRPSKRTPELQTMILSLVTDKHWRRSDGLPKLSDLLSKKGCDVSRGTLSAVCDTLHDMTGLPELQTLPTKFTGRPSKQTFQLEQMIDEVIESKLWDFGKNISTLRKLLADYYQELPSADTLARMVKSRK